MPRREPREWLLGELERWQRDGLLAPEQARRIGALYADDGRSAAWGPLVFSGIGAVVVGLGIILLFAYNWHAIPRFVKLALVFGAVGGMHAAGLVLRARVPKLHAVAESLGLLGSMAFGAGIWLVAQIYHIDEHFPRAFLVWGLGAAAMAYAWPSVGQGALGAVLLAIWAGCERIGFDTPQWAAPVAIGGWLAWIAYAQRSRVLVAVVVPAFLVSMGFAVPSCEVHAWTLLSVQLSLAALLIAASWLAERRGAFSECAPVLRFYGWSVFTVILYLMTFPRMARHWFDWERVPPFASWVTAYWALPLAASIGTWVWVIAEARRLPAAERPRREVYLVPMTVALGLADVFYLRDIGGWAVAAPFNLVFLGLAATLMAEGCRDGRLKATALGSILLLVLVIARYFDLFESLVVRGLTFLGLGGVLVAEGVLYTRARRQRRKEKEAVS